MFLVVFLDVVEEFFAFEDFDVGGEAEDEAGGAFEAVDGGGEDPFAVDAFEVLFGEGVFLHEEGLGAGVELEGDGFDGGAGHAEDVGGFDLVPFFEGPGGVGDLDFVDAHDFVDAAVGLLDVVSPDVDHVGGEGEGFDQAVAGVVAVGRFIAFQDYLLLVLDGSVQGFDVGGIDGVVDIVGDAGAVIDAGQLPLQVPLEGVVIVDALDHPGHQVRLLVGEVDELLEIRQPPVDLPHLVHIAVELVHYETRLTDGVDVAVHRARSDAHLHSKRINRPGNIPRE